MVLVKEVPKADLRQTPTSMTIHDISIDPKIFDHPHSFLPERWLGTPVPDDRYFVPFGKGTRMCQGIRYVPYLRSRCGSAFVHQIQTSDSSLDKDLHMLSCISP